MTVEIVSPKDLNEAVGILTSLAQKFPRPEYVFRGQQNSDWRLCTSYERYWGERTIHGDAFIDSMVRQFRSGINRLGLQVPIDSADHLSWLEYARHHGLPAPLLDFSWSPFVALYFAFDGVRDRHGSSHSAAVYCLNLDQLAKEMARHRVGTADSAAFVDAKKDFENGSAEPFKNGFPMGELLFIRNPSVHTRRMHAQLGNFLYYTMGGFPQASPRDLEELFEEAQEGFESPYVPNEKTPMVQKILFPHAWISEIFSLIDIMNINGSSMLLSAEGVAKDVYNAFNYQPRAPFLRE